MRIDVITLFPEMVQAVIEYGVVGRASDKGLLQLTLWNPRDYTKDKHRSVDDRPYGGKKGRRNTKGKKRTEK
jgi:tRNA (guanine37-N1)-methyltransferase